MTTVALRMITILHRYVMKSSGSIVCQVRNGEDKEYCVTLNANGSTGCVEKATGEECKGNKSARKAKVPHTCYHITECQAKEAERTEILAERDSLIAEVALSLAEQVVTKTIGAQTYIGLDGRTYAWNEEMENPFTGFDEEALDEDAQLEQWTHEELSREAYVQMFNPCGL
jgi:hypothetical protein